MVEETGSAADNEARWWADWFEADFSWDGLSKFIIPTGGLNGERNLQEYWRRDPATGISRDDAAMRDAGELIDFDGRTWHLAHLPPRDRTGSTASSKANPDHPDVARLNALVATRIAAGVETLGTHNALGFRVSGPDGRALLDGAVLWSSPNHPQGVASPLHLSCCRAWLRQADLRNFKFGPSADFSKATFTGDANFARATFTGHAVFYRATFTGDANFYRATFTSDAGFNGATFKGDARFYSATFKGDARFRNANFTGDANFSDAIFTGDVRFYDATFKGDAVFWGTNFTGDAVFSSATFTGDANFSDAIFTGNAVFKAAVFLKPLTFVANIANPQRQFMGAFLSTRFAGLADFSRAGGEGRGGLLAAAFGGAQFEKGLILTDGLDREADQLFPDLLQGTRDAARADLAREKKGRKENGEAFRWPERIKFHREARDRRLIELESGCRTLKVVMGAERDEVREQRYYRYQLRARHRRSDVFWLEKLFGGLYGLTSNYGSGLLGPLLSLGLLTFASGLGYWAWADHLGVAGEAGFPEGQSFALSVVFKPFAVLAAATSDPSVKDWWPVAMMNVNASVAWGLRVVTTLQSLASGVLIFLLAVGVRRRFQIG
jgi:hypothetical protein